MNREIFRFDEISIRGLCMDLLRNIWMILAAGISLWFLATGWHNLTYEPQWNSDVNSVEENVVSGEIYPRDMLVEELNKDKKGK